VLVHAEEGSFALVETALARGAAGVVLKQASADELADAIRLAAAGEVVIDSRLRSAMAKSRPSLRPREREVLERLARGESTREIAAELVLSVETVATHVRNAMRRLGAHTRSHAVAIALRAGAIERAG
jgi:DNA-binding NarL/FixJ family response regulator